MNTLSVQSSASNPVINYILNEIKSINKSDMENCNWVIIMSITILTFGHSDLKGLLVKYEFIANMTKAQFF